MRWSQPPAQVSIRAMRDRRRNRGALCGAAALVVSALVMPAPAQAQRAATSNALTGNVTLPLSEVESIRDEIERLRAAVLSTTRAPEVLSRAFKGRFAQGQLAGTLEVKVRLFGKDAVRIPLLTRSVALGSVAVDGKTAMPISIPGGAIGVNVVGAGNHSIVVAFSTGQTNERFKRQVSLPLTATSQTALVLDIDESDIDVQIAGVVLKQTDRKGTTRVEGALRGDANPEVVWRRRLTHAEREAPELENTVHTLVTPHVDLVKTKTRVSVRVLRGEADRIRIAVPAGVEVTHVSGPAVLQWVTEKADGDARTLVVLFRHLVGEQAQVSIHTQAPVTNVAKVQVRPLTPEAGRLRAGLIAIAGRAGFELATTVKGATEIPARELPEAVIQMSQDPLVGGYRYENGTPSLTLAMHQNETLALTQALIDDMEAATVVTETGAIVTKVRLSVRNTTRQHLKMELPAGAEVTHALIDGVAFAPGTSPSKANKNSIPNQTASLLIPLRQSEKVISRRHVVESGETLGAISLRYFNQTNQWRAILDGNGLAHPSDLRVGQSLFIPPRDAGAAYTESAFVLEVAYRTPPRALGWAGKRDLVLPSLDLPVMRVAWHVYLPSEIEPLKFAGNLEQLDGVRYDPLRRARQFFDAALRIRGAWAGGYENILKARKRIFRAESRPAAQEAMSDFPLSGERTRFRRVLLRADVAKLELTYARKSLLPFAQGSAFLLMAALVLLLLRRMRTTRLRNLWRTPEAAAVVVATVALLLLATLVLGVHRAMLLGTDAALIVTLVPYFAKRVRDRGKKFIEVPVAWERWLRLSSLAKILALCLAFLLVLQFPLLLSTFVLVVLATVVWRRDQEVGHA